MSERRVERVRGRGCAIRGHNIDTDRIIPARYLRCVSFDGLGEHAFADDRQQAKGDHPLDQARFDGAAILIVDHNFGSGSSREHAPQALMRRGFRAFVGGSFAEIFAGNCLALGLACATLGDAERARLQDRVELRPSEELELDVEARTLASGLGVLRLEIAEHVREHLLAGTWDATAVLLDAGPAIEETASRLPYARGFAA